MLVTIANCQIEFVFQCPQVWSGLQATADWRVRHCHVCQRDVHLCTTAEEVEAHAAAGHCVAVDRLGIEQAAQERKARQREHIRRRKQDQVPDILGITFPDSFRRDPPAVTEEPIPENLPHTRPAGPS